MKSHAHHELQRWLRLETEGRTADADRACRRTFLELPAVALPAGMTERLVSAVAAVLPQRQDPFLRPGVRAAIAASFLVAATVAGLLRPALAGAGGRLKAGHVIDLLQAFLAGVSSLAASVPGFWAEVLDVARLGSGAAASPAVLACLALFACISLFAFRLLTDLTLRQKGLSHVDVI